MTEPHLKLSGILSMTLGEEGIRKVHELQPQLPPEAKPLADKDLHVTLWKLTPTERKRLEEMLPLLTAPGIVPDEVWPQDRLYRVERPSVKLADGKTSRARTSWIALVKPHNSFNRLRDLVRGLSLLSGLELSDYENERPFHISIANLTGNPFDSVGDVTWDDTYTAEDRAEFERRCKGSSIEVKGEP